MKERARALKLAKRIHAWEKFTQPDPNTGRRPDAKAISRYENGGYRRPGSNK